MARKKKHEEHANHEAWAIPYGDLITLLLAFFVVMYAISSINEGKFRVLSDSLSAAFRGQPRTLEPVQVGEKTDADGQRWLTADAILSPLGAGDYVIEVTYSAGGTEQRLQTAVRVTR